MSGWLVGLPKVLARVAAIDKAVDIGADKVTHEAAVEIVKRARSRAPVRTGHLRGSIKATRTGDNEAVVSTDVRYAPYQEFGTSRGVEAHEFLRTAIDDSRRSVFDLFKNRFSKIVRKGS